jgi:hypothetical protein
MRWLELGPRIRKEFHAAIDDNPLFHDETASVGVFAAAAGYPRFPKKRRPRGWALSGGRKRAGRIVARSRRSRLGEGPLGA